MLFSFQEQQQSNDPNSLPDLELVSCSGQGKNGALCVLQVNPIIQ